MAKTALKIVAFILGLLILITIIEVTNNVLSKFDYIDEQLEHSRLEKEKIDTIKRDTSNLLKR